jgi:hypothetical protein
LLSHAAGGRSVSPTPSAWLLARVKVLRTFAERSQRQRLWAVSAQREQARSLPSFRLDSSALLYNSHLQYIINYNPSFCLSSFVNRIEVSFVNSFYFNFYYVYFIGIIIFLISIAVSFIGYTLVFGNLSYYGVIVILGLVSSFPSLLSYFIQFIFIFFSFLLILFIIVFLFLFIY